MYVLATFSPRVILILSRYLHLSALLLRGSYSLAKLTNAIGFRYFKNHFKFCACLDATNSCAIFQKILLIIKELCSLFAVNNAQRILAYQIGSFINLGLFSTTIVYEASLSVIHLFRNYDPTWATF